MMRSCLDCAPRARRRSGRPLAMPLPQRLGVRFAMLLATGLLAAALLLAAVAPAVSVAQEAHGASRLFVADARAHTVTALNAANGSRLATFGTPGRVANLVRSSTGRWVYAVHTDQNRVTVIDSGLRLVEHGDHMDVEEGAPFVRATVNPGRKPIDTWAGNGMATIHNDDDGTLVVFDDRVLEDQVAMKTIKGAGAGHNNAAVLGDTVLLSLASEGRVTAYGLADGAARQAFEGCPGTHGWTTRGQTFAAVGCTDGVLTFTIDGGQVTARKIAEPAGSPDNARVSTITSHPASPVMIGNFGQGLAIVDPAAAELRPLPLTANPVRFAFDHDGEHVIVLTLDGKLHAVEATSGEVRWSVDAVSPVDTATTGAPRPALAVGESVAFVSDPPLGRVVKIDLARGRPSGAPLAIGGTPTLLTLVHLEGEAHAD